MGTDKKEEKKSEQKQSSSSKEKKKVVTQNTSSSPSIEDKKLSAKDFCDSQTFLYKNRVLFLLDKKYPKQKNTVKEWMEILSKEEVI